jgi:class 3 adenylate cyclase/tetratricopeptide (TPR) repeat protein
MDLKQWLEVNGLGKYASLFAENEIDFDLLPRLSKQDLDELGLPVGAKRRLVLALESLNKSDLPADQNEVAASTQVERRQLTVMFCDLVGSTQLSQRLDPEELRRLIREYQDACVEAVARYEGHTAQFLGDGVLAYFGYPVAHEGEAERAIRAALSIIERIARLSAASEHRMQVRIGIDTGLVVIGQGESLSEQERTAIGDAPNVAARLQSLAKPGAIVISERAHQLASGAFDYVDLGIHALKGIIEPMQVWQVAAARAMETRFDAATGGRAGPMLGRDKELDIALGAWQRAKQGQAQVLLICGEPGIGKSRILRALREQLGGEGIKAWQYQCSPFFTNTSLYPVTSHIERALGFDRSVTTEQRLERLEEMMTQQFACSNLDLKLVGRLLGLPVERKYGPLSMSPDAQKAETLRVLIDMVEHAGQQKPVALLYEDLHWADPTTLEIIDQLIGRKGIRGLIVMTYRPYFDPPWIGQSDVTALTLGRLDAAQTEQVATRVAGNKPLPAQIIEQIVQKTDGVPLFIEELTKAILESRVLSDTGTAYELAGPDLRVAIPSSLRDSLMARLDRNKLVKEVAQTGAAIGRDFSHELVAAVSPLTDAQLGEALGQLTESGLAFRQGDPPAATYTFKHALVQDAAYDSLLKSRRKELHGKIATALEQEFPKVRESQPEVLAHHYTEAASFDRAGRYWYVAAQRANARFANTEAIAQCQKGLDALAGMARGDERVELELELRIALVTSLRMVDRYEDALEQLQLAELLASENQRLVMLARIHTLRGNILFPLGQVERCLAEHQAAFEFAQQAGSDEEQARALGGLGDAYYVGGRYQTAHEQFDRCVTLCRAQGLTSIETAYLPMRATTHMYCLRFAKALDDCHSVMELIAREGIARGAILSRNISSWTYLECQEFAKAQDDARSGLELVDKLGAMRFVPLFNDIFARIRLREGDRAGASKLLEESWTISRKTGVKFLGPFVLGAIALAASDPAARREALREGKAILDRGCVSHSYFWFYRDAIEVSLAQGDWAAAQAYAVELASYFRAETPPWPAFVVARGRALAQFGSDEGEGGSIDRIRVLRDQAVELGMRSELTALEAALASASTR